VANEFLEAQVEDLRADVSKGYVITNAIKPLLFEHPTTGHGTIWDQVTKSDEESIHLAKAVMVALRKAGYSIAKSLKARSAPPTVGGPAISRLRVLSSKAVPNPLPTKYRTAPLSTPNRALSIVW
jgi:hypothetical protein